MFAWAEDASNAAPTAQTSFEEKLLGRIPLNVKVEGIAFNPMGSLVACAASSKEVSFVIVGDVKGEEFRRVSPPLFSPDGTQLAYVASAPDGSFLVVGGRKCEKYSSVVGPVYAPDGSRFAYAA